MKRQATGFTLIEIAIVLVIIGLLLGGVLKGQELITGARVRNLISQQDGAKAAFFGFQDRYRALPGDYASASTNINCPNAASATCINGNGNGQIESAGAGGGTPREHLLTWTHLTAAGFLNGSYNMAAADTAPLDGNSPKNPYSIYLTMIYDDDYGVGTLPAKHNLKTGNQIPVEILAEVDRKVDDGQPYGGSFQYSTFVPGGTALTPADCIVPGPPATWLIRTPSSNCGGSSLF